MILGEIVRRERLFALLDRKLPTRAFWISGPGGSGKTTLVASYLEERKAPCLWYQVDALDGDPATFFYYLGQAASTLMEYPHPPMPLLTPEYLPNLKTFILRYFEKLYQRIRPDSWLIFDNFQDAPEHSPLLQILAAAVKQLPAHIVLTIVSRSVPPPAMSRFIANRTMKPIGGKQIRFSPEEFSAFLDFNGTRIAEEESKRLYRITEGWIAGAILWILHCENQAPAGTFPAGRTPENIFDYFATEILEKVASPIRSFLQQTSLLPFMTAEMARELTDMQAEEILETLNRKNFFVEKRQLPATSYQYHPLFREFLQITAAREYPSFTLQEMYVQAAELLHRHGCQEEAIDLYCKAREFAPMAAIVVEVAPALIAQGRFTTLSFWIETLPAEYTEKNPWLLFWHGLAQMACNPPVSQTLCTRAFELFAINQDIPGQILSWSTCVEMFFMLRSGFTELDLWIKNGERLGELLSREDSPPDLAGRFCSGMLMALLLRDQGHPDLEKYQNKCEALLKDCRDLQVTCNILKNLFWSYHWIGQIDKAQLAVAKLEALQNVEDLPPMARITLSGIFTLAGVIAGDHPQCLSKARETLALADSTGIHVYDFMMYAYISYTMLGTGELGPIQATLDKMKETLMPFAVWDQGHYHFLQAWYQMQAGNLLQAKSEMTTAAKMIEGCENPFTIALSRILQSQLLLELGEAIEAEEVLQLVCNEKRLGNSRAIHFIASLALADCAAIQNNQEKKYLQMQKAFSIARKHGLSMPFGLCHRRLAALCAWALDAEIETSTVMEVIRRWHLRPPDPRMISDRWPWPIRIYTLGRFAAHCEGETFNTQSKLPKKPLQLLTFLISAGREGIFREKIASRLWPDSDGDRAMQNLNTTLHRLRKLLGRDEAVVLKNGQLILNDTVCWVDSHHFIWLAQQSKITSITSNNREYLERALGMYQGPFTTGHENIPVAVSYSGQIEKHWQHLLAAAVPLFVETTLAHKSMLQKALAAESTATAVFSILVNDFKKMEKKDEAFAIIQRCHSLLAEQGISYSPKTMALVNGYRTKRE
ncbi:hypothetical protein [Desulfopila sp. IMCC35006]|uniref:hypothetical protein n=1 Tax=Desulfopila sp. IMCC35006 TaxID=2569542 RepID=UPI00142EFB96|nr:hypothetical protein [Desulfopila sp. IMCC35006]